jgi:hypothetical protein
MVERARGLSFAQEASARLRVLCGAGRQKLESHLAAQPLVLGKIHNAHCAGANRFDDPVVRDESAAQHGRARAVYRAFRGLREPAKALH